MLVLGILMAIAIPLIGGVREAANNSKCRSNLKQLHTAIFAFAIGNEERFPDLPAWQSSILDQMVVISSRSRSWGFVRAMARKPKLTQLLLYRRTGSGRHQETIERRYQLQYHRSGGCRDDLPQSRDGMPSDWMAAFRQAWWKHCHLPSPMRDQDQIEGLRRSESGS